MNSDEKISKLMKYKKKDLCVMVKIAMDEKTRWEAEFFNLDQNYDELLEWKNELKERLVASEEIIKKLKIGNLSDIKLNIKDLEDN